MRDNEETELNPGRIDLKPGRRNRSRRKPINAAMSDIKRAGSRNIGRRKTVRMSASGLMSRKSKKAAKRAMFRMGQKAKMLACHACSRKDFLTEKSLKKHTAKFHTPGQKSPRGFRTRRDAARDPAKVERLKSPEAVRVAIRAYKGVGYYEESSEGYAEGHYWTVVMRKGSNVVVLSWQR